MKPLQIAVLPGDGIGGEVMDAALPVFDRLGLKVDVRLGDIGWEFWKTEGNAVPERTWKLIEETDTVLLGAITSKPNQEAFQELAPHLKESIRAYVSPVIQLRQRLGLFANVRPVFTMRERERELNGNMNFVVIRENTEGLYAGFDFHPLPEELYRFMQANKSPRSSWHMDGPEDGAVAIRLMTRSGVHRLLEFAFQWAEQNGYGKVTWVDKPNVMRQSGQFALDIVYEVAGRYPHIELDVQNVDAAAMWMVRNPTDYGVIVCENQFGDILSDLGAGLMGGLGLAPSANLGAEKAYFEPVHGSAPKHAGKGIVNPSAMLLTIALMLQQRGFAEQAVAIRHAVEKVIAGGRSLTYDFGGTATTREMAREIIANCG